MAWTDSRLELAGTTTQRPTLSFKSAAAGLDPIRDRFRHFHAAIDHAQFDRQVGEPRVSTWLWARTASDDRPDSRPPCGPTRQA